MTRFAPLFTALPQGPSAPPAPPRRALLRAAALAGVAAASAAVVAAEPAAALPVPTLQVRSATHAAGFEIEGTVQPVRQATVAAQTAGNVMNLRIKAGDRVKAGQVLAQIDERDAQAGLARADAGVAQAQAALQNARLQYDRTRDLRRQGFISPSAEDSAFNQLKAAESGLAQAQAARTQAALARGFSSVVAPFDAVVLATHAEAGDLAAPGRPIATLYAPQQLRAVVQVPASRAALARSAQKVEVRAQAAGDAAAAPTWIVPTQRSELPAADAVSQTVEWRLDLPAAPAAALRPGQSVQVRFADAKAAQPAGAALTVPAAAVLRRGELTAVYVAQANQFVLRAVRTATPRGAAEVDVLAGLRAGERIAADAVKAGLAGALPAEALADATPAQR